MTYQDYLNEVEARLKKAAKGIPKEKAAERAFFMKVKMPMLGLTVPQQRQEMKKGYTFSDEALETQLPIWDYVWHNARTHEGKMQAGFYLGSLKPIPDVDYVWSVIKAWPDTMNCWDQSDEVSKAYSYMYAQKPGLLHPTYKTWNTDENPWRRRQSVVGLFCYAALHKKHPPVSKVLPLVKALLGDEDYYVQKGVGWTLRETYNVYPDKAVAFVLKHVGDIHPDAFSATIEKMTPAEKKQVKERRKEKRKPKRRT